MVSTSNNTSCRQPTTIPAFSRKQKLSRGSEISNAVQESFSGFRRARRPEAHRRSHSKKVPGCMKGSDSTCDGSGNDDSEEAAAAEEEVADEKAEVEEKILALQRIVPGGDSLAVDKLFEETAGYILALQFRVKALRALTSFVEGSEKEKRKLGG